MDEPALNSSSLSLCLGKFLLSEADETIYKNNDKDTVFSWTVKRRRKKITHTHTQVGKVTTCLLFLSSDSRLKKQNLKPEEFCPRRREVEGHWVIDS